jgi:hypothetical protein
MKGKDTGEEREEEERRRKGKGKGEGKEKGKGKGKGKGRKGRKTVLTMFLQGFHQHHLNPFTLLLSFYYSSSISSQDSPFLLGVNVTV